MGQPKKSSRPFMPGYGVQPEEEGSGLLPWSYVEEKMAAARNYWLAMAGAGDRPHAAPVWGIWFEHHFYFSSGADSRKGRNLAANPNIAVHLESGDQVVILEGQVREVAEGPLFTQLGEAYFAKYQVHLTRQNPVYVLLPEKAFAWDEQDFPTTATRWSFDEA